MRSIYTTLTLLLSIPLFLLGQVDTVEIQDSKFVPDSITVQPGTKVVWKHVGSIQHTTTSGTSCTKNGKWDSDTMNNGDIYTYTFDTIGNYPYFCIPHCSFGMTGRVKVDSSSTSGIQADNNALPLSVMPRMFSQQFTVDYTLFQPAIVDVQVFNVLGNKVSHPLNGTRKPPGTYQLAVQGSDLPRGIYFCQVRINDRQKVIQLVRQ